MLILLSQMNKKTFAKTPQSRGWTVYSQKFSQQLGWVVFVKFMDNQKEIDYQANYENLTRILDLIPLTYFQRKEVQHYLDQMEDLFRQANI